MGNKFNLLLLQNFRTRAALAAFVRKVKKCYKQTCIALAIKKVRLFRTARNAAARISMGMERTRKAFKGMNAELAASDLYGQVICQEGGHSAIL